MNFRYSSWFLFLNVMNTTDTLTLSRFCMWDSAWYLLMKFLQYLIIISGVMFNVSQILFLNLGAIFCVNYVEILWPSLNYVRINARCICYAIILWANICHLFLRRLIIRDKYCDIVFKLKKITWSKIIPLYFIERS